MDIETPRPASSGWKRLGVVLSALWVLLCLVVLAMSLVNWYRGKLPHPFAALDLASVALAVLLFVAAPIVGILRADRFFRWTVGYRGRISELTLPRAAWVVVAFLLAWSFLLPGWLGLAWGLHDLAANAMGSWMIFPQKQGGGAVLALLWLPQWAAYTLGTWVLMRVVDWVWRGFAKS